MKMYSNSSILANLFRGREAVGGKLYFDDEGMTFKSHALNIQTGDTRIEYKDITDVKPKNIYGLAPTGMLVSTSDGTEYTFVVYHRKNVIAFLRERANLL